MCVVKGCCICRCCSAYLVLLLHVHKPPSNDTNKKKVLLMFFKGVVGVLGGRLLCNMSLCFVVCRYVSLYLM